MFLPGCWLQMPDYRCAFSACGCLIRINGYNTVNRPVKSTGLFQDSNNGSGVNVRLRGPIFLLMGRW
jgi:hypothetical protein